MQFDQDFCLTICISLGNFKFQTIFWPRRSPKTEKRFRMVFRIPKVSLKIRQDLWFWNSLKAAWWPQCKMFHRSEFILLLSHGILNMKAKKLLSFFSVFHGQVIVWILKLPSKTAKLQCKHPLTQLQWETFDISCYFHGINHPSSSL